jgi:hypothetical protein
MDGIIRCALKIAEKVKSKNLLPPPGFGSFKPSFAMPLSKEGDSYGIWD